MPSIKIRILIEKLKFQNPSYDSAAVADFVYTSETNESCEKHSTQR